MSSKNFDATSTEDTATGLEFGALAIATDKLLQDDNLAIVYTAAFGCTSTELLTLIFYSGIVLDSYNIPDLVLPWVRVFIWMIMALCATLKYYPLFAVIRCRRIIIEPLIGLLYTIFIFSSLIYQLTHSLAVRRINAFFLIYIPTSICYVILLVYFLYKSVRHTHSFVRRLNQDTDYEESKPCASQLQYSYVKWLLKKPECDINDTYTGLKRTFLACSKDLKNKLGVNSPLRASPRVIATLVVASIALFQVGIQLITVYAQLKPGELLFSLLSSNISDSLKVQPIQTLFTVLDDIYKPGTDTPETHIPIEVRSGSSNEPYAVRTRLGWIVRGPINNLVFYVSFSLSSIFMVVYVIAIFISYRKDLEKIQRGDYTFLPMKLRKSLNDNLVAASLRYSGAQIAYLIWCYIFILLMGWIVCFVIAYIVILPLMGKVRFWFFNPVLIFLPLLIINFGFRKLQVFLSRRFFLQDFSVMMPNGLKTQKALALDNIKMFNVLSFFMFFFHVIIGFVSCVSRIVIGLVIGLVSLARLDRCMLPMGFEKFDKGYSTYIGMLMVEVHHRNPVASVFCNELLVVNKEKGCANVLLTPVNDQRGKVETKSQKHRRICRKWAKLYTLINNPSVRRSYVDKKSECSIEQVEIAM